MHSTSPGGTDFPARSGVLFVHNGRLLHERFQHFDLPNKEGASIRSLDTVVTIYSSLAKGMPYKNNRGERALAVFNKRRFQLVTVPYSAPLKYLVVRRTTHIYRPEMDGISGVSAVIALGGFVATTIQQLDKLMKDIAKAPKELLGLVRYLEDLKDSLNGTAEFIQQLHSGSDGKNSCDGITNAVQGCADIIKSIEVLIKKTQGTHSPQNQLQKKLAALKYVLGGDEIDRMETRLDRAINRLNLAISVDSLHQ